MNMKDNAGIDLGRGDSGTGGGGEMEKKLEL